MLGLCVVFLLLGSLLARSTSRPSYETDRWGDVATGGKQGENHDAVHDYVKGITGRVYDGQTTTNLWGHSGGQTTARYSASGLDRRQYGLTSADSNNNGFIRIQAQIVKLTNAKGLTKDGSSCDTFSACDTQCNSYIDTDTPYDAFPGARATNYWYKEFQSTNENSPGPYGTERKHRDTYVCGVPFREANFRAECEDLDTADKNDLINNFDCRITRIPDSSEATANWYEGQCVPQFLPDKMGLTFRYRIFAVPQASCNLTVTKARLR